MKLVATSGDDKPSFIKENEIHVSIKGDEAVDKKLKASRDRELILKASSEEDAKYWLDILKQWVTYSRCYA